VNKVNIDDYPYVLKHMGTYGCGEDVYYFPKMPQFGSAFQWKQMVHPDGSAVIKNQSRYVCKNCGKNIGFKLSFVFNRQEIHEGYCLTREKKWGDPRL